MQRSEMPENIELIGEIDAAALLEFHFFLLLLLEFLI
jgi:hypothetical protein